MRFKKGFLGKFGENFCRTAGHFSLFETVPGCRAYSHQLNYMHNLVKNKKFNLYRLTSNLLLPLKSYLYLSLLAADYFLL